MPVQPIPSADHPFPHYLGYPNRRQAGRYDSPEHLMNPLVLGPTVEQVVSVKQRCDTAERRQNAQAGVAGEHLLQLPLLGTTQLFVDPKRSYSG